MNIQQHVAEIVNRHREKAASSPYDHKVALVAIGAAAATAESFRWTGNDTQDLQNLVLALDQLRERYNDPSGEYSSGKGEIGSLARDIESLTLSIDDMEHAGETSLWQRLKFWA